MAVVSHTGTATSRGLLLSSADQIRTKWGDMRIITDFVGFNLNVSHPEYCPLGGESSKC